MNCTGNCNQGRNCRCAPREWQRMSKWIAAMLVCIMIALGVLVEVALTGDIKWSARILFWAAAGAVGIAALYGITKRVIDAIDWITRYE